ncbi:glutathione-dependent formaldehyde-activating enzyme [Ophiocordyceps camponoti-floridani]|uniref:Glutathione-dependent formaldehyde-activating enzyme n=1 Tax=Ophiocordyceps camponoti-floridani TaxID=2030778 RepID=A0A8H4Q3A7_9HYPO|nr:glutathione-dependent formaldehyde-activating enzyme [Ophiocordyceps camponoti-floridani]
MRSRDTDNSGYKTFKPALSLSQSQLEPLTRNNTNNNSNKNNNSDSKMPLSGHCLCKAVTYKADVDAPLMTGYDHCDDCQRQTGSTYSLVALVLKAKFTTNGPVKKWSGKGSSGKEVHRLFCSECGSPIAHDPDAVPEIIVLKAGTLDKEIREKLKPDTEIWTAGKLPFCQEKLAKAFTHMPQ